jgi:hypothetical protein
MLHDLAEGKEILLQFCKSVSHAGTSTRKYTTMYTGRALLKKSQELLSKVKEKLEYCYEIDEKKVEWSVKKEIDVFKSKLLYAESMLSNVCRALQGEKVSA